ncbi:MAG: T9SS type A sorting domain-containing protein [Bacteroidetes bacterium]|nr:T9SS type A sorting domain-containing protein [Bacteroidota bacterium]
MLNLKSLYLLLPTFLISATAFSQCAKFEPPNGTALLILGQDLGSVGGFTSHNNGYMENVGGPTPAGITTYTDFPYLQGLTTTANYGAGDICAQCITDNSNFSNSVLAIGLYLVNELSAINSGQRDGLIKQLGDWIKSRNQPVFLRIGYEYDGQWNNYNPADYKLAYKRIVDKFRANEVTNCAYVWQSSGYTNDTTTLLKWYPGDNYVDWMAYSHFKYTNMGVPEMALARKHHKPLMIAEATPQGDIINSGYSWNGWFAPLFQHIQNNKDVIKALAYINANWNGQSMWAGQNWGDTRIENSNTIKTKWLAEINTSFWLKASPTLFTTLNCSSTEIENLQQKNAFIPYPNPSDGELNIYLNDPSSVKEINITNLDGETVYKAFSFTEKNLKISLKDEIANGIYVVSIRNEVGISQQKIVLNK